MDDQSIINFVHRNPSVKVGTIALLMGLTLSPKGLAQAGCALRHAKRWLKSPAGMRVRHTDLRSIACREVGIGFGPVEVDADTCPVMDHLLICEPGSEMTMDDGTIVRQVLRYVPTTYTMTTNRDAILRPEARKAF